MMRNLGFSLIELLIVIAIVAMLAAMAIPAYKSYIVKARVLELIHIAHTYKTKLIENIYNGASIAQEFNLDTDTIAQVAIQTQLDEPRVHLINVVAKMQTATQKGIGIAAIDQPLMLQLQGKENGEIITWTCNVASQYLEYVPAECKHDELI